MPLTFTGRFTQEGKPVFINEQGQFVTEETETMTEAPLNEGLPTNVPTVWGGQQHSGRDAFAQALRSGANDPITYRPLPAYPTIGSATDAAEVRSAILGHELSGSGEPINPHLQFRQLLAELLKFFPQQGPIGGLPQVPAKGLPKR